MESADWRTKPSDRFVLRWIKVNLAARVTPLIARIPSIQPWMVTVTAALWGMAGGVVFALGWAWLAGLLAAVGQILDGVDGQLARLTGRVHRSGGFLDSVLDRYADGAMVIGCTVYVARTPGPFPLWLILLVGGLAIIGSNAVSYSAARAEALGLDVGRPTRASKGTRTAVMIVCALGSPLWAPLPFCALAYLAVHPHLAVCTRILRATRSRVA